MYRVLVLSVLTACTLFVQQGQGLLTQGFLQLDIKGDSTYNLYRDQIVVLGFSYAIKAEVSSNSAAGARLPNAPVGADSVTLFKRFDVASPKLVEACFLGKHFAEATLTLTRTDPDALPALAEVTFKQVIVTGIDIQQPTGTGSVPTELVTLQFSTAEWCYTKVNPDGREAGRVCTKYSIPSR